jgi:hypothetical protein
MTDRVGKGWFSILYHRSELIGSGIIAQILAAKKPLGNYG